VVVSASERDTSTVVPGDPFTESVPTALDLETDVDLLDRTALIESDGDALRRGGGRGLRKLRDYDSNSFVLMDWRHHLFSDCI